MNRDSLELQSFLERPRAPWENEEFEVSASPTIIDEIFVNKVWNFLRRADPCRPLPVGDVTAHALEEGWSLAELIEHYSMEMEVGVDGFPADMGDRAVARFDLFLLNNDTSRLSEEEKRGFHEQLQVACETSDFSDLDSLFERMATAAFYAAESEAGVMDQSVDDFAFSITGRQASTEGGQMSMQVRDELGELLCPEGRLRARLSHAIQRCAPERLDEVERFVKRFSLANPDFASPMLMSLRESIDMSAPSSPRGAARRRQASTTSVVRNIQETAAAADDFAEKVLAREFGVCMDGWPAHPVARRRARVSRFVASNSARATVIDALLELPLAESELIRGLFFLFGRDELGRPVSANELFLDMSFSDTDAIRRHLQVERVLTGLYRKQHWEEHRPSLERSLETLSPLGTEHSASTFGSSPNPSSSNFGTFGSFGSIERRQREYRARRRTKRCSIPTSFASRLRQNLAGISFDGEHTRLTNESEVFSEVCCMITAVFEKNGGFLTLDQMFDALFGTAASLTFVTIWAAVLAEPWLCTSTRGFHSMGCALGHYLLSGTLYAELRVRPRLSFERNPRQWYQLSGVLFCTRFAGVASILWSQRFVESSSRKYIHRHWASIVTPMLFAQCAVMATTLPHKRLKSLFKTGLPASQMLDTLMIGPLTAAVVYGTFHQFSSSAVRAVVTMTAIASAACTLIQPFRIKFTTRKGKRVTGTPYQVATVVLVPVMAVTAGSAIAYLIREKAVSRGHDLYFFVKRNVSSWWQYP